METTRTDGKDTELKVVLRFLERTREGEYAEISEATVTQGRVQELAQPIYYCGEEYIYGIS
jgi:hypothetical protein